MKQIVRYDLNTTTLPSGSKILCGAQRDGCSFFLAEIEDTEIEMELFDMQVYKTYDCIDSSAYTYLNILLDDFYEFHFYYRWF